MPQAISVQMSRPSPTLNTVVMVENVIKNSKSSVITIAEIKRALPRQVNHNALMVILEYLERSGKIAVSLKGITWLPNTNSNLPNNTGVESDMNDIEAIKKQVIPILKAEGVKRAAIFGSVARGEATSTSDIDFLLDFKTTPSLFGIVGLKIALEDALKRGVDLVLFRSIDQRLRKQILKEKVDII